MGALFSYFKKKSLDSEMDYLHEHIQSMRRSRSLSVSFVTNLKRFQLLATVLGGILTSLTFYYYIETNDKLWFKISISSIVVLSAGIILLHFAKSLLSYRIKTFEQKIIIDENKLRDMFSNYLDEGSYKKVLLLKKKYDPTNRILKDLVIPDPDEKPVVQSKKKKQPVKNEAPVVEKKPSTSSNALPTVARSAVAHPPFKTYGNRGIFEKFVDRILGDGPEYRNALICSMCHTHNGLVPPEDFLKISFKCYKCNFHHYPRRSIGLTSPCVQDSGAGQSNKPLESTKDSLGADETCEDKLEDAGEPIKLDDTLPKPHFDHLERDDEK